MPEKSPSKSTFQLPSIPDPLARLFSASGPCADKRRNHGCGDYGCRCSSATWQTL